MSPTIISKLDNPDGPQLRFNLMFKIVLGQIYDAYFPFLCELFLQIYTFFYNISICTHKHIIRSQKTFVEKPQIRK